MSNIPVILLAFAPGNAGPRPLRDIAIENNEVYLALRDMELARKLRLIQLPNASVDNILKIFREERNHIAVFHFGGHAGSLGLLLNDADGNQENLNAAGFAEFLSGRDGLELLFLNGCSTQAQTQGFLDAGVGAVISTSTAIGDSAAKDFAIAFYKSLASNSSISSAFTEASGEARIKANNITRDLWWDGKDESGNEAVDPPWKLFPEGQGSSWKISDRRSVQIFDTNKAGKALRLPDLVEDIKHTEIPVLNVLGITTSFQRIKLKLAAELDPQKVQAFYGDKLRDWRPYGYKDVVTLLTEYARLARKKLKDVQIHLYLLDSTELVEDLDDIDLDLQTLRKEILVIADSLALALEANKDLARFFDVTEVGGCLVPVSRKHPKQVRALMVRKKKEALGNLHRFLEKRAHEGFVYVELDIRSRPELYRRITNTIEKHLLPNMNRRIVGPLDTPPQLFD